MLIILKFRIGTYFKPNNDPDWKFKGQALTERGNTYKILKQICNGCLILFVKKM